MTRTKKTTSSRTAASPTPEGTSGDLIVVGRLVGTLGLRGELKVAGTRLTGDALAAGTTLTLVRDGQRKAAVVASVRTHSGRLAVTLEGAPDRTSAERFVGCDLAVAPSAIRLASNEHLDVDLIGSRLVDELGATLGTVANVAHYPAQDCLVLAGSGALVPLVRAFVREIDIAAKTIVVDLPPGLLDPAQAEEA